MKAFGAKYQKAEGEAAFYGPKIDVQGKKCARQRRYYRYRAN